MLLRFSPKHEHIKMVALSQVEGVTLTKTIVQLLPGVNEVTDDEWKAMKGNITNEIEKNEIVILAQKVSDGRGKPGGRKAKDLVQMPVNIAVNYVNECTNPQTLKKWYEEETREEVRLHITKKIEKLELEFPESEIPEVPNASPMSLEEWEQAEDEESKEQEEEYNDSIDYNTMSKEELVEVAKEKGLEVAGLKKQEIIDMIKSC